MRHENPVRRARLDSADVAAVWPVSAQIAPVPIPEIEGPPLRFEPTPAAADVPASVGWMILASYAAVIAALFFATAGTAYSMFMIAISASFVVMFFAVPGLFLAAERMNGRRVTFAEFMQTGMNTFTGHSTARAALVQMMIVPVFLTIGIAAIGIAASVVM
jgi:hypothetical protein